MVPIAGDRVAWQGDCIVPVAGVRGDGAGMGAGMSGVARVGRDSHGRAGPGGRGGGWLCGLPMCFAQSCTGLAVCATTSCVVLTQTLPLLSMHDAPDSTTERRSTPPCVRCCTAKPSYPARSMSMVPRQLVGFFPISWQAALYCAVLYCRRCNTQDKLSQINEFLKLLAHTGALREVVSGTESGRPLHVLDCGCGSSHLTLGACAVTQLTRAEAEGRGRSGRSCGRAQQAGATRTLPSPGRNQGRTWVSGAGGAASAGGVSLHAAAGTAAAVCSLLTQQPGSASGPRPLTHPPSPHAAAPTRAA